MEHQKLARQWISKRYSQRQERRAAAARSRTAGPIRQLQAAAGRGGGGCSNDEVGKDGAEETGREALFEKKGKWRKWTAREAPLIAKCTQNKIYSIIVFFFQQ